MRIKLRHLSGWFADAIDAPQSASIRAAIDTALIPRPCIPDPPMPPGRRSYRDRKVALASSGPLPAC